MADPSSARRMALRLLGVGVALLVPGRARAQAHTPLVQPVNPSPAAFAARALVLRDQALGAGDQGYGAVIVRDNRIVGEAPSRVVVNRDPTAHAEMEAIRDAARRLGTRDLSGCAMYGSARACPMCAAAAYWANLSRLYYGPEATDGGPPRLGG
jgi:tRNA(Arg) A34 adenosine deaminase TadA